MAASPTCRHCGAALPRSALACPQCGVPAYSAPITPRRRWREAVLVGMAGSGIMAAQSASMVIGGALAFVALGREFAGARGEALVWIGHASVFVGFTLLFDLVGVSLLAYSFLLHARILRREARSGPKIRARAVQSGRTAGLLFAWVLVTIAWRVILAAIIRFYPTPFGANFDRIPVPALQRAASVMLAMWVLAAFLLFLGARSGARLLREMDNRPASFWRILWPLEAFIHLLAAVGLALVVPVLLANLGQIEVTTLRIALALAVVDAVLVPTLGFLAYTYLFRDHLDRFRNARGTQAPHDTATVAARPPEEA